MEPEPGNPIEVEGTLNPAAVRSIINPEDYDNQIELPKQATWERKAVPSISWWEDSKMKMESIARQKPSTVQEAQA